MNIAILAVISLLALQLVIAGGSALIYARMRSKADVASAETVPWSLKMEAAIGTANAAKAAVELLNTKHYENLRSLFEDQGLQIANLKAENVKLVAQIESLKIQVQTLQRADRGERAKLAKEPWEPPAKPGKNGSAESLDALLHAEGIPLNANGAAPQPTGRPGFGESAH